ncbi:probable receptor-like serine/threonine-protein kinase At5g57670 [Malania oleifera]|uniref:probable receptor-like serine/threonine-protein kinase At5g57670 n=1 Tax=Malania oleifera TaxID=397392 RepID=UPI0025ADE080|nr:probable receptor-like serine/threonine-protein kinase At5g57670 [Malania oleifera]
MVDKNPPISNYQQFFRAKSTLSQTMVASTPAKILIGIPLDADYSKELLSWAVRVLAQTNDTIVALHVLVKEQTKKLTLITKDQTRFRRAKAFVISVMGEFAKACQSKQINLEAKVAFCSSVGRGLTEEANHITAEFLLVGGSRNRSNGTLQEILRYCFQHAPDNCAVISIGRCPKLRQILDSDSSHSKGLRQLSSRGLSKSSYVGGPASSAQTLAVSKAKREKTSPKSVLVGSERESNSTEEDTSSFEDSSVTESPPQGPKHRRGQRHTRKQSSVLKLISSFFNSPFDINGRERNENSLNPEKHQSFLRCFSHEEISKATNDFHPENLVGLGGYSEVYRGDLSCGREIAVKRLAKDNSDQNKEKEFLVELGIIGHVCHRNTAKIIGFCVENGFHLIFNFCPNGNLASALHGGTCNLLEWSVRYKIATGIARGLHYLHKCCKHRIIHRDIKASNVLLGTDYEPQITDFGLAKWLPNKWTHHAVMPIEGTFGYLAPEYFMHGIVDEKTDVFSFGVLLLEIITGRKPVDSSKQNLLHWAQPLMESGDIIKLADPKLGGKYDVDQVRRLVLVASYCIRQSSMWRPSMTEVLEFLTSDLDSEIAWSWRMSKCTDYDTDDYSMVVGCNVSTDIILEDL